MSKPVILFVDHDVDELHYWKQKLSEDGFEVKTTIMPDEGLRLVGQSAFFAVIVSHNMPEMSGTTLLEKIKNSAPKVCRILLTDNRDYRVALEAINRAEVFRFISLPCEDDTLLEAVRAALAHYEKHRETDEALKQDEKLRDQYRHLLARISQQTFDNRQLHQDLEKSHLAAIELITYTLKTNSPGLWRQSLQVLHAAKKMMALLKIPAEAYLQLEIAALLHTVGKIGLPEVIYSKPKAQLSPEEDRHLHNHPVRAFNIISMQPQFHEAAEIVLHHCEHYDGTGYPNGLKKDAILPAARMLAVAKTYAKALKDVPFGSQGLSHPAYQMLENNSGTLFDPDMVDLARESILVHQDAKHQARITNFWHEVVPAAERDYHRDFSGLSGLVPAEAIPQESLSAAEAMPSAELPTTFEAAPVSASKEPVRAVAREASQAWFRSRTPAHGKSRDYREVSIRPEYLAAGMILSRDLVTEHGIMLLHKGSVIFPDQLPKIKRILENDPPASGNIHILRP